MVRIDNRLVHGQILESWVPFLKTAKIIVVNDQVASDLFMESVIKMAVPHDIELFVYPVEEFAKSYAGSRSIGRNTIILFADVEDVINAYQWGFRFESLNIGNVNGGSDKRCVISHIFMSSNEINDLMALANNGVEIEIRGVPPDKPLQFSDAVKKMQERARSG
ncbi:MAG: PTS sugar transporter subunit IIB [Syntrophales bacterium]|jgi:PTS system mannose-specific IIB component|nr:PTS sugar transporter subunit IIB [Syntrophales bacterium]MDY0044324.1 PTS sugar transporter subunit IIB [Syntrophales bacterium]